MKFLSDISTADLLSELSSRTQADRAPELSEIVSYTADVFEINVEDILGRGRTPHVATARHTAIALTRELTHHTLQEIGDYFTGRDHGTVINSIKQFAVIQVSYHYAALVHLVRIKLADTVKVSKTSVHSLDSEGNILKPGTAQFSGWLASLTP